MVDVFIDVFNFIFTAILVGVFLAWLSLLHSMYQSFTKTPFLDIFENKSRTTPKVSVILPARNEEDFISKCLETLSLQDYKDFEVIAIDDSSEDKTAEIIAKFAKDNSKIIHVSAREKPEKWMGKNWACMEGFKKATGEIMLFTDADTKFEKNVITLAVAHLQSENLDALTVIPRLRCIDRITKITLPMLSTFLHSRYSALNVNNPKKKVGYFFGSFFIIKRKVYEEIGTHEKVKQEIIEDGALGKITKESGYALKFDSKKVSNLLSGQFLKYNSKKGGHKSEYASQLNTSTAKLALVFSCIFIHLNNFINIFFLAEIINKGYTIFGHCLVVI